jgi:integrase
VPNDSLTELAKVISQGLPGPDGGLRRYIEALFGDRYQKRYHAPTAVRDAYALADGDEGVPYAGMPDLPPLPRQGRKLPDAPSDEDVVLLLGNASGWLRIAIALSTYGGLRMGEARALEVRDVDFKRGHILVRHALSADEVLPPKSGHERVVPLAPELRAIARLPG